VFVDNGIAYAWQAEFWFQLSISCAESGKKKGPAEPAPDQLF
jgi:hypothetical protein